MSRELTKIKGLGKVVKRQQEERKRDEQVKLFFSERERLIDSLPASITTEFWCASCLKDFTRQAIKITQRWTGVLTAFFETRCACGKYCRRQITDKTSDPYYQQSRMLQASKKALEIDMLQPDDPRFRIYYGDPYAKYYENLEAEERRKFELNRHGKRTASR
jgi:hypothetical protein